MTLQIVQTGDPVLRKVSRPMSVDEIRSASTKHLIEQMRDTMRAAPGVGLANSHTPQQPNSKGDEKMNNPQPPLNAELVVSYLTLRKALGYLGLLMPIIVRLGAYYFEQIPSNESVAIGLFPTEPVYHPLILEKFPQILTNA